MPCCPASGHRASVNTEYWTNRRIVGIPMSARAPGSHWTWSSDFLTCLRTCLGRDGTVGQPIVIANEQPSLRERNLGSGLSPRGAKLWGGELEANFISQYLRPLAAFRFFALVLPRVPERGLHQYSVALGEGLGGRLRPELVRIMGGPDLPRVPVLHNDLREDPFSRLARRPV